MKALGWLLWLCAPAWVHAQTSSPLLIVAGIEHARFDDSRFPNRTFLYAGVAHIRPYDTTRDPRGHNARGWDAGVGVDVFEAKTLFTPQVAYGVLTEPFYFGVRVLAYTDFQRVAPTLRPEVGLVLDAGIGFRFTAGYNVVVGNPGSLQLAGGPVFQLLVLVPTK